MTSMTTNEVKINLSEDIIKEIERYKILSHKKSTEEAVTELIKYALKLPQYFKDFDWGKAEAEADEEIATEKTKLFDSVDEFISDLKE